MATPVVIIDDDEWLMDTYERTLSAAGYSVARAANAVAAMQVIDEHQPQAIILDLFMPGPNGIVLLHELQSHSDLANIPVILITNAAHDINAELLAPYGVRTVLDKTAIAPEDVALAVKRALA